MKIRATQEELDAIKSVMDQEKIVRVFKRYQALYLFLSGKTYNAVADIIGVTSVTVYNVHKKYIEEGTCWIS